MGQYWPFRAPVAGYGTVPSTWYEAIVDLETFLAVKLFGFRLGDAADHSSLKEKRTGASGGERPSLSLLPALTVRKCKQSSC